MIRTLSKRLEHLENQVLAVADPVQLVIEFVEPTGEVVNSLIIDSDPYIRAPRRSRPARPPSRRWK